MPDVLARAMAVIMGGLLVGVIGVLVITSRPPSDSRQVVAEFRDAFPILEGMAVRSNGAPAGSVGKTTVNDEGLARVTLLLDKDLPAPRADATATIRQFDSTGDSYISFDPGTAPEPLRKKDGEPTVTCDAPEPGAPCTNTLAAPRLDDLINAFGPPEEAGVKLIIESLSQALEGRGADVNRAALRLVPTLDAANKALAEVNGQNAALKRLITDMEDVSRQGASRSRELGTLIDGLARTLDTTAARTGALDRGLQALPETQRQLRTMLASLRRTADETRPLADQLRAGAPGLGRLLDRAPGFLDDLRFALRQSGPTLELTRKLLVSGAPTIAADPQRVVTGAFDLAPAVSNLLKGILGGDETIRAFFGDEKDGGPESRPGYGFGLGAATTEPGNQPGFPADWTDRKFLRVTALLNCEAFGGTNGPGCLAGLLQRAERAQRAEQQTTPLPKLPKLPTVKLPSLTRPATGDGGRPAAGSGGSGTGSTGPDLLAPVKEALGVLGGRQGAPAGGRGDAPGGDTITSLLDYLLR
ncbi:MCE family protein [Conexibacter sp. W3-3-2]|uniref:MlaD family protein n=1 Tax=Conexibacter sp. W3-3-2 TaxID=2675227 RepID=UPI0012B97F98|nr:MlaD family protein [Conexibacter sp. W3-3-2]MTD42768.1 MCE family protein [Conexibacter sp. W3-3-2]